MLNKATEQFEVNIQFFKPSGEELSVKGFQLSDKKDVALFPLSHVIKLLNLKKAWEQEIFM